MKKRGRPKGSKNTTKTDKNGPRTLSSHTLYAEGYLDGWLACIANSELKRAKRSLLTSCVK